MSMHFMSQVQAFCVGLRQARSQLDRPHSNGASLEALQRAETQRQALRSAPDPHESRDGSIVAFLLDAEIR